MSEELRYEKSCGAVVYYQQDNDIKYVLVCEHGGYWVFPKGHVEAGETELETALREIKEETGLTVTLVDGFRIIDEHNLAREGRPNTIKQTVYFLAKCDDPNFVAQESEISKIELLDFEPAMAKLQFDSFKNILMQAHDFLEKKNRQLAIENMVREISGILADCNPSIYLYGSSALNDFKIGWSDIDILVLTEKQMSQEQAELLVNLRQAMLEKEPENPYYRSFEGGMLTLVAFLSETPDRVVYWGTSGERITDSYSLDSFGMAELVENSVLLHGRDIQEKLTYPEFVELYADVKHHYETIRNYAGSTGRSLYSFGWLLDIARCIYTLCTGKIIAKTKAGEWALENNLCPDKDALTTALKVRRNPLKYKEDKAMLDYAETLGEPVQRFADVLENIISVIQHYDLLIEENNDPFRDSPMLQDYMCQWDGALFLEAMELATNKNVLEIGIGTGRIAAKVAPHCAHLTGIDISPKTIERAKENLKEHTNISFICGDFCSHEFAETFDIIYSSLTMMHFENKQQVVTKVAELLKDNGIFVLSIDKNQDGIIDMGDRKIKIYPDTLENISELIKDTTMSVTRVLEIGNAYIIVSKKGQ